ncbi:MAG: hypothetical protein A2927_02460 [Candidatus Komeilibacteria bacterium RIFCSPLOWO2_01_FULL_45_10]|uniref:Glutamyl-tRNA amidotransferase n=1 Tax=Candidatus Komeilibacteria bacterium RIFCSPLOWO2_01_FULL_45_10 TaxID=1798550 RepID=A0A1G2BKF3_9BACT|nr:MAG: hypothetical protein A2927_02460 [Candidatus Komeilibacteria bacterium RIFCSPLOWO2_01_FULL_45_10]
MSALSETINQDYTVALKGREAGRVAALRLLRSALQNAQIAKREELADEDVLKVLASEVKKRQEAILSYRQGQREDLAAQEEAELAIIKSYLPPELPEEAISKIIEKVIAENNFTAKDFGQTMKLAVAELKGQADGKRVAEAVKKKLEARK